MSAKYIILLFLSTNYVVESVTHYQNVSSEDEYGGRDVARITVQLDTDILYSNLEKKLEQKFDRLFEEIVEKLNRVQNCNAATNELQIPQVSAESDLTRIETETATLRCMVTGNPEPKITWRFEDNIINNDVATCKGSRYCLLADGALKITSLNLNDSGVYTCVAENTFGIAQDTVTLNVTQAVKWVPTTIKEALSLADCAVVAGYDADGSPLWVIRAISQGDVLPGKYVANRQLAYVPYGGREFVEQNIEVCCAHPEKVRWVESRDGNIPPNAIVGGDNNVDREPLYVGRAEEQDSLIPGKVAPSHKGIYISLAGREIFHRIYEVLCLV